MRNILLIGAGRFGCHVAEKLEELNVQFMVVDKNEERAQEAAQWATTVQIGDAGNREFLKSLGIRNFDVCIVAIRDDILASLEITALLKELGAKRVVSRTARDTQARLLRRVGADAVVDPEKQMAEWTAVRCASEHMLEYIQLSDDYAVCEVRVPDSWVGRTLADLAIRRKYGMNIIGVREDGGLQIVIDGDYVMKSGQTMLILGHAKDVQTTFRG
ncbi:MAG: TrkA family potassium uptake protein [Lachnospiraceae bacterium]|jgi:trk system potassium uptake protein TrkA|nr:TrkA family potassium uptake protein [Lachnospiraceae bacterium]